MYVSDKKHSGKGAIIIVKNNPEFQNTEFKDLG